MMSTNEDLDSYYNNEKKTQRELERIFENHEDRLRILEQKLRKLEDVYFSFQSADEVLKCNKSKSKK